ncbi:uncharacterized protein KGF55_000163 [Candida pseudojiufengensis]|uniref:uncharacterized protein n=1 Tax=Candida pseudojiufengensis TaxID=497109 RepID=UPI002224A263|nr:uncharacterized protein KGF55_000163 [Candida pseudojiufengensis]KAI5966754.1 hypothetical protein KGF55_000163 [Candida pseudojiufengensis]
MSAIENLKINSANVIQSRSKIDQQDTQSKSIPLRDLPSDLSSVNSNYQNHHTRSEYDINTSSSNETIQTEVLNSNIENTIDQEEEEEEEEDHQLHPDNYPDGGLKAYLVILGSFLGCIVSLGIMNSVGAIQAYVSNNILSSYSESSISWIFSIYYFLSYAIALISGPIFDKNGSFWLNLGFTIFVFLGLIGIANSQKIYQFILGFISLGIGTGIGMVPLISVVSHYFFYKRGMAVAIAMSGGSVGGLAFPLLLRKLYSSVGFVWAIRILAFICLGCMILSTLLVKERFRRHSKKSKAMKCTETIKYENNFKKIKNGFIEFIKIKDRTFVFVLLGGFFSEFSLVLMITYYASYAIDKGFNESNALLLLTIWNATGIAGRCIPGILSDYLGRFNVNVIMVSIWVLSVLVLLLPFGNNHNVLWAFAAIGGTSSACILTLLPACLSQITPTKQLGQRYGIINFYLSLANLFGVPIAATILDTSYDNLIIFTGVLAVTGASFWTFSRISIVGTKLNVKV